MLRRTILAIAIVAASLVSTPAMAGRLVTPSIYKGSDTTWFFCEAVNVGEKVIKSLTVTLVQHSGPATSITCTDVGPTEFCQDAEPALPFFSGFCRIDFSGSKKDVRGAISMTAVNDIRAILPAN